MSWFRSNWKPLAAGVFIAAAGAAGVFYPGSPASTQQRPLLSGLKHGSREYLQRHAQGWLTCPSAATKCYRWKMQEASGDITDDLSGDSAILADSGSPTYSLFTPIPMSDGFSRKAIYTSNGDANYFDASSADTANQTTNDFSTTFWWYATSDVGAGGWGAIWTKWEIGNPGIAVFTAGDLKIYGQIVDASGQAGGVVTAALAANVWHLITVNFDRSGNVNAIVDNASAGIDVDISAKSGTLSNATTLKLFRLTDALYDLNGGALSEVLIADGLTTLAEHQAAYAAFKPPTGITFTQTTGRKFPGPSDASGARLLTYAPGQWPAMYAATRVNASTNPLGLGFPRMPATTNVIGYANQIDQWTLQAGTTADADKYEAPDGSMSADEITQPNGGYIQKLVVGGGNMVVGERWCGSFKFKKISGDCTHICNNLEGGGGTVYRTAVSSTWITVATYKSADVANPKGALIWGSGSAACALSTNCVYAISDAQYESNNLTPPCTSTAGDVSQTCNASAYTSSWSDKTNYMPSILSRGEIEITASVWPSFEDPATSGYLYEFGQGSGMAILSRAGQMSFQVADVGGAFDAVSVAKPLQAGEESRTIVASWDTDKNAGLTNTSPRKYAGLSVNGSYQGKVLEARPYNATTGIPGNPVSKLDAEGNFTQVIGSGSTMAVIESEALYARPAQTIRPTESTLVLNADFSGSAYLEAQAIPRFECPSGVDSANCWIWDMGEFSGSLYDRVNGVALAPSGTPRYRAWTGLLARGNGRRGVNFTQASVEYLQDSGSSIGDITTGSLSISSSIRTTANVGRLNRIVSKGTPAGGYDVYHASATLYCGAYNGVIVAATQAMSHGAFHTTSCVLDRGPNTLTAYVDGVAGTPIDASGVISLTNGEHLTVGAYSGIPANTNAWDGEIYEVSIRNTADSAATILARYKQTIQNSTYWSDDANTVAHYRLNESTITNGIGVKDSSGNGNHLTVVNGTPDPRYRDMPWPAGSGLTKPATESTDDSSYFEGGTTIAPDNDNSFSLIAWVRSNESNGTKDIIWKTGADTYYRMGIDAADHLDCMLTDGVPNLARATSAETTLSDGGWHLAACKWVYADPNCTAYVSVDGAAFVAGTAIDCGAIAGNANAFKSALLAHDDDAIQISGQMIVKNYALTDAEVASYYKAGTSPVSALTYARTNKACYDAGNDPVTGMQVRCFQANEVPFAWHDSLDGVYNERLGFGLPVHDAVANLALQSQDVTTTWANSNTSDAANSAVAPDGTFTADTVTATAADGDLRQVFASITAVVHTYCQYLKRNGAANVAGFIRIITNSTDAVIASTAFTATSTWQRFCVTGTATVDATRVETEITTDTESVYWWGASLSIFNNTNLMIYCPTTTASVTCNATSSNYIPAASMASWTRAQGVINWTGISNAAASYGFDLHNGTNLNGAVRLLAPTTEAYIYDSTATLQQRWSLANAQTNTLTSATVVWDNATEFYTDQTGTARHAAGMTYQSTYHGPWPVYTTDGNAGWTPAASTDLHIGMAEDGTGKINGIVRNVSVYGTR